MLVSFSLPISLRGTQLCNPLKSQVGCPFCAPESAKRPLGFPPDLRSNSPPVRPVRSCSSVAVKRGEAGVPTISANMFQVHLRICAGGTLAQAAQLWELHWPQKPMRSNPQTQLPIPDMN